MAYLVLVVQVLQLHLLSANIVLHLINAVEGLEGLVQGNPLWIYGNLVIIICVCLNDAKYKNPINL